MFQRRPSRNHWVPYITQNATSTQIPHVIQPPSSTQFHMSYKSHLNTGITHHTISTSTQVLFTLCHKKFISTQVPHVIQKSPYHRYPMSYKTHLSSPPSSPLSLKWQCIIHTMTPTYTPITISTVSLSPPSLSASLVSHISLSPSSLSSFSLFSSECKTHLLVSVSKALSSYHYTIATE